MIARLLRYLDRRITLRELRNEPDSGASEIHMAGDREIQSEMLACRCEACGKRVIAGDRHICQTFGDTQFGGLPRDRNGWDMQSPLGG